MTAAELATLMSGLATAVALVMGAISLAMKRRADSTHQVYEQQARVWQAIADEQGHRIASLDRDVQRLRRRVDIAEDNAAEARALAESTTRELRQAHALLDVALTHLRDLWVWIEDGGRGKPPAIPAELRDAIRPGA